MRRAAGTASGAPTHPFVRRNIVDSLVIGALAGVAGVVAGAVAAKLLFKARDQAAAEKALAEAEAIRQKAVSEADHIRRDAQLKSIPVVLVTSLEAGEHRERGAAAGADAYIVKSAFDQGQLLDTVGRLL